MAKILLPHSLRQYTEDTHVFNTSKPTFKDAIAELTERFPLLRKALYKNDLEFNKFLKFYFNTREIAAPYDTELSYDSTIVIITAIAGG